MHAGGETTVPTITRLTITITMPMPRLTITRLTTITLLRWKCGAIFASYGGRMKHERAQVTSDLGEKELKWLIVQPTLLCYGEW